MTSILTKFRLLRPSYAVIDGRGTILRVNAEWKSFGKASGLSLADDGVGSCYFDYCPPNIVGDLADKLRKVAKGWLPSLLYLYPCPSPSQKRWFVLIAVSGEHGRTKLDRVTLVHIDVTELLLGQRSDVVRQLADDLQSTLPISAEAQFVNALHRALNEYFEDAADQPSRTAADMRRLTRQEERVASLLAEGHSNEEIAAELDCSVNTTKRHVSAILRKLGLESRTKVAAWYHQRQM